MNRSAPRLSRLGRPSSNTAIKTATGTDGQPNRTRTARHGADQPMPAPEPERRTPATVDSAAVREIWPELLRQVEQRSKPTMVLLQNASVRAIGGNTLVLALPTAGLARQLRMESAWRSSRRR